MKISEEIQSKANALAQAKREIKVLEDQAHALQKELISGFGIACDIITPTGKLAFTVRENYEVKDKIGIIKLMGQKCYNAHSTISKTGVAAGIGSSGVQDALDKGLLQVKSVSEFFTLRK